MQLRCLTNCYIEVLAPQYKTRKQSAMDEHIKAVDQRLEQFAKRQEAQNKGFEDVLGKLMQAITELQGDGSRRNNDTLSPRTNTEHPRNDGESSRTNLEQGIVTRPLNLSTKLEFPKFDGSNA